MGRAAAQLGLARRGGPDDNRAYEYADGSLLHVYLSPGHAGGAPGTVVGWYVEDIEGVVEELTSTGVVFGGYDEPPIVMDGKGIATFEDGETAAYFKDPDGHVLSLTTGWG